MTSHRRNPLDMLRCLQNHCEAADSQPRASCLDLDVLEGAQATVQGVDSLPDAGLVRHALLRVQHAGQELQSVLHGGLG
eukprot:CAMPEP_0113836656 /NCGR_PEP_ID=MMETSP0328-20130328/9588_1 /TAXON_ID=39455 /ORGANISM="Alexandrium minutum" /LENGTH=78 /DNA_ID=CAMNT_0000805069 /DNA_START=35 /DNA_END=267 /DNA_ORIENTATION=+ /assembly_acc=CAM_ASM_000350